MAPLGMEENQQLTPHQQRLVAWLNSIPTGQRKSRMIRKPDIAIIGIVFLLTFGFVPWEVMHKTSVGHIHCTKSKISSLWSSPAKDPWESARPMYGTLMLEWFGIGACYGLVLAWRRAK